MDISDNERVKLDWEESLTLALHGYALVTAAPCKVTSALAANKMVTSEDRVRHFSKAATLSCLRGYWFSHLHSLLCTSYHLMTPCPFSVVYICIWCAALSGTSISDWDSLRVKTWWPCWQAKEAPLVLPLCLSHGMVNYGIIVHSGHFDSAGQVQMGPTMLITFWWYAIPVSHMELVKLYAMQPLLLAALNSSHWQ